jgi:autotransporter adhesin
VFTTQQVAGLQAIMNQAFASGLCNFGSNGTVTCGKGTVAEGAGATALGTDARAEGAATTAVGQGAVARHAGSVAIGAGAQALADPTTAVGNMAIASGNNAVALGANTLASGSNSVALGQGSVASRDNSVSVGNASLGLTRTITNVAPGVAGSDAVNVDQLRAATDQANDFAARGVAAAMAIPSMPALAPGKRWAGAALGNYAGKTAVGLAFGYQVTESLNIGAGIAASTGGDARVGSRVQAGYSW